MAPTPQFSEGFESGSNPWSFGTVNGPHTASAEAAYKGGRGCIQETDNEQTVAVWTASQVPDGHPWFYFRVAVRYPDKPPGTGVVAGWSLRNEEGVNHANLFYDLDRDKFRWDLVGGESEDESTMTVEPDTWYLVETRGFYGSETYTLDVRINGADQPPISAPDQEPTTFRNVRIGTDSSNQVWTRHLDDVALWVGDSEPDWVSTPAERLLGTIRSARTTAAIRA